VTGAGSPSVPAILIVEDEWLIADMIDQALGDAGYRTIGPAASVDDALALIASERCDAALLDVNLGFEKSYPVVDRLIALHIPHLLLTGYSRSDLPERYRESRIVDKPLAPRTLIAALSALLAAQAA
jgi:DNA-binding response OmpR family regulator